MLREDNVGHIRLGRLPKTKEWEEVIELLRARAPLSSVARASAEAAREGLRQAETDPGLAESFYLLAQLPRVARSETLGGVDEELRALSKSETLIDLGAAFAGAVDARLDGNRRRSDVGEIAELSAIETLMDVVGRRLPSLIAAEPGNVRRALAGFEPKYQFAKLARVFFARFVERYLAYYLSRELAAHVGPGGRFAGVEDHSAFNDGLRRHCYEASAIVEAYAGAWRSKKLWEPPVNVARQATHVVPRASITPTGDRRCAIGVVSVRAWPRVTRRQSASDAREPLRSSRDATRSFGRFVRDTRDQCERG